MIPTMILFGALVGRWPGAALAAAAISWPALLVATGVMGVEGGLLAAAGLSVANAAVGVAAHQCVLSPRTVGRARISLFRACRSP